MSGFKINFKLQTPEKIKPFGKKPNYSLRWFGLTDGLLWIEVEIGRASCRERVCMFV